MRISTLALLGILAIQNPVLAADSTDWDISPSKSKMSFVTYRSGRIPVTGHFSDLSGKITYDGKNLKTAKVVASIPLASIKTGHEKRDSDLKSRDYFDVKKFAHANFTSGTIRISDAKTYILNGELDLHGIKKRVDLALAQPTIGVSSGKEYLQATASTVLYPNEFSLDLRKLHPEGTVNVDLVEIQFSIFAEKGSK